MDIKAIIVAVILVGITAMAAFMIPSQRGENVMQSSDEAAVQVGQETAEMAVQAVRLYETTSRNLELESDGITYPAYLAEPQAPGPHPAVVLLHSINGLDEGYVTMSDRLAERGYVVLTIEWQTFERIPHDDVVIQLTRDGIDYLTDKSNVDASNIGLTGFCIGGRYTMLLLPQIDEFASGVAWYGFPYRGPDANENWPQAPADVIDQLDVPMLILHGTDDSPSPIADIYQYAQDLDEAGKYFELKVYQGEPHSFMLSESAMRMDDIANDALEEMINFFDRTLK